MNPHPHPYPYPTQYPYPPPTPGISGKTVGIAAAIAGGVLVFIALVIVGVSILRTTVMAATSPSYRQGYARAQHVDPKDWSEVSADGWNPTTVCIFAAGVEQPKPENKADYVHGCTDGLNARGIR
jgi:hypothetical protein